MIIAGSNTKILKTHRLLNKMLLCLSLLTANCTSFAFLNGRVCSVLGPSILQILNVPSDHLCRNSFVFWFENEFLKVKPS